jgi:hypothetical protein
MIFDPYNLFSAQPQRQPCEVDLDRTGIDSRKFQLAKSIYFDKGNQ